MNYKITIEAGNPAELLDAISGLYLQLVPKAEKPQPAEQIVEQTLFDRAEPENEPVAEKRRITRTRWGETEGKVAKELYKRGCTTAEIAQKLNDMFLNGRTRKAVYDYLYKEKVAV